MLEQKVNIFSNYIRSVAQAIGITTNGVVKQNKRAVMGAGVAKQALGYWPDTDKLLGAELMEKGNHVFLLDCDYMLNGSGLVSNTYGIFSFPTKHHWRDNSTLELIDQSARELVELAAYSGWTNNIYLPTPGCGLGGLKWADVKPVLEQHLDDRFIITYL